MTPGTTPTANAPDSPPRHRREADWTLVQLTGGSDAYRGAHVWRGWWVALNQHGEVYLNGDWADCWESVKHWVRVAPPSGAAYGEDGIGWRGALRGLA